MTIKDIIRFNPDINLCLSKPRAWISSGICPCDLGNNCIVFENFTASIEDLIVAN
jgi:hypothetical protein